MGAFGQAHRERRVAAAAAGLQHSVSGSGAEECCGSRDQPVAPLNVVVTAAEFAVVDVEPLCEAPNVAILFDQLRLQNSATHPES